MYNTVIVEVRLLIVIFVFYAKFEQGSIRVNCPADAFLSIGGNKVIIQVLILQSPGDETSTHCAIISISLSAIGFTKKHRLFFTSHNVLFANSPAVN